MPWNKPCSKYTNWSYPDNMRYRVEELPIGSGTYYLSLYAQDKNTGMFEEFIRYKYNPGGEDWVEYSSE